MSVEHKMWAVVTPEGTPLVAYHVRPEVGIAPKMIELGYRMAEVTVVIDEEGGDGTSKAEDSMPTLQK